MAIEFDATPKHRQRNKFLGKFYGIILTDNGFVDLLLLFGMIFDN